MCQAQRAAPTSTDSSTNARCTSPTSSRGQVCTRGQPEERHGWTQAWVQACSCRTKSAYACPVSGGWKESKRRQKTSRCQPSERPSLNMRPESKSCIRSSQGDALIAAPHRKRSCQQRLSRGIAVAYRTPRAPHTGDQDGVPRHHESSSETH